MKLASVCTVTKLSEDETFNKENGLCFLINNYVFVYLPRLNKYFAEQVENTSAEHLNSVDKRGNKGFVPGFVASFVQTKELTIMIGVNREEQKYFLNEECEKILRLFNFNQELFLKRFKEKTP